jgi:hypothetical protein
MFCCPHCSHLSTILNNIRVPNRSWHPAIFAVYSVDDWLFLQIINQNISFLQKKCQLGFNTYITLILPDILF